MELTGDLGDFALADILQIMALSRKTGTILLESDEQQGRILLEEGKITYASLTSVESFADRIIRTRGICKNVLQELLQIGSRSKGMWGFDTLVIESGILEGNELMADARIHFRSVLTSMLAIHRGCFNIILNQALILESYREVILTNGLDVGEVLLEAARCSDEMNRFEGQPIKEESEVKATLDLSLDEEVRDAPSDNEFNIISSTLNHNESESRLGKFRSLLAELNTNSTEADITLILMRFAGELMSRAILFLVGNTEIRGLGQFGIGIRGGGNGAGADDLIRSLRVPLASKSLLSTVVETGRPSIGRLEENYWNKEILRRIGGHDKDLTVLVIPLVCSGRVLFILYGDNYPGKKVIEGFDELIIFAQLAGIILEKIKLEEKVSCM
jgi:hypothetical protein